MTTRIRRAEPADIPAIAALLLEDARRREALDHDLWAVAPDAPARVTAGLRTLADPVTGPFTHHWMVAEAGGTVRAVAHGVNVPAPPIVDLHGGTAGILLDDSHLGADGETAAALLAQTERVLADAGAVLLVAATPAGWTGRTRLLQAAGYEPTTLYMAKTGFGGDGQADSPARPATEADVDGIARLSARHRADLQAANPVFWNIHAEADARFAAWMRTSLGFADRSIFVTGRPERIDGYIIAQPGSPLHLPPAHEAARVGLIDDFHAGAFEPFDGDGDGGSWDRAAALLDAAETAFRAKGLDTAMAICPARFTAKAGLLEARGYRTANLWTVKARLPS